MAVFLRDDLTQLIIECTFEELKLVDKEVNLRFQLFGKTYFSAGDAVLYTYRGSLRSAKIITIKEVNILIEDAVDYKKRYLLKPKHLTLIKDDMYAQSGAAARPVGASSSSAAAGAAPSTVSRKPRVYKKDESSSSEEEEVEGILICLKLDIGRFYEGDVGKFTLDGEEDVGQIVGFVPMTKGFYKLEVQGTGYKTILSPKQFEVMDSAYDEKRHITIVNGTAYDSDEEEELPKPKSKGKSKVRTDYLYDIVIMGDPHKVEETPTPKQIKNEVTKTPEGGISIRYIREPYKSH